VSDFVLSVVPTDPRWQPDRDTGRAAGDVVASLALASGDGGWCTVNWHDQITVVDCGENLQTIRCPHCGQEIDSDWFGDLLEQRHTSDEGFTSLDVVVPCCTTATTFDRLDYDWPMAFAMFEIAVWNGSSLWGPTGDGLLDPTAVATVETVLGHPIKQVRAHY
jgi:hypothetical protein